MNGSTGWNVNATSLRADDEAIVDPGRPARPALMLNLIRPESRPKNLRNVKFCNSSEKWT